jgi:hypothetical protein
LLALAILFPHPTNFQLLVFRTLLALSAAGIAAAIPGFLNLSMDAAGLAIRAGGALAIFLLIYRLNPAVLLTGDGTPQGASHPKIDRRSELAPSANGAYPKIPSLENLIEIVPNLSANQRTLLACIAKSKDGLHVGDVIMHLRLSR